MGSSTITLRLAAAAAGILVFLAPPASSPSRPATTTGGSRVLFLIQTKREPYRYRAEEVSSRGIRSVSVEGRYVWETSFAPRGDAFVYSATTAKNEQAAFLTSFRTPRRVPLTSSPCRPPTPCTNATHAWSPGGKRVVLAAWERGRPRFFVVQAATGARREVTPRGPVGHDAYGDPSWAPNGRLIGFVRRYGLDNTNLCCRLEYHVMRTDGSGRRWVYRHRRGDPAYDSLAFSWAPDSRRLAFSVFGRAGSSALGVIDLRTRRVRWLLTVGVLGRPSWSPDSRWLAVAAGAGGIHLFDSSGRQQSRRLGRHLAAYGAVFAPDGRSLFAPVATRGLGAPMNEIRSVPVDGGPARLLYRAPRSWSVGGTGDLEAWPGQR